MISLNLLRLRQLNAARMYFIFSMSVIVALTVIVPPFSAPDEFAHVFRAASLSSGYILPIPGSTKQLGVMVDSSMVELLQILGPTAGAAASAPTAATIMARQVNWSGRSIFVGSPNTAQYGPLLYLPQAIGLAIGRGVGLSVVSSYEFARLLTGAVAVSLASIAVANAERGAALLMVVLSTPMFLFLATSLSQDGMLIAVSALFAALAAKSQQAEKPARTWIAWFCGLLAAMGRPPYALLSILLSRGRDARPVGLWLRSPDGPLAPLLICVITALWLSVIGALAQPNFAPDPRVDPQAQLTNLLRHPGLIPEIAAGTVANHEIQRIIPEVIGVLGALAITLPSWAYRVGIYAILLAAAVCAAQRSGRSALKQLMFALVLSLSVGAVYAALYLSWTPVNEPFVVGVQGRYLLPYLAVLPAIIPSLVPSRWVAKCGVNQVLDAVQRTGGLVAWGLMILVTAETLFVLHGIYEKV